MNSPSGDAQLAVLLVIAGLLGFIARALTGTPFFGFIGLAGFVFALAVVIRPLVDHFRAGASEQRKPRQRRSAEYIGEDGGPVPADASRSPRNDVDYRTLD